MRCLTLLCAAVLLANPAVGTVRESDTNIVTSTTEGLVSAIPVSAPTLPQGLATDRDVFVFITAGAAYTEVTVLGRKGIRGRRLAEALDAAFPGSRGATVYTNDEDFGAAYTASSRGRFFTHSSRTEASIGCIVSGIRAAGFIPHALLRMPRYASVTNALPESKGTRRFHWYDVSDVPPSAVVGTEAQLSRAQRYWAGGTILFPLLAVLLNLAGILIALNHRLSLETRKLWYKRLGWRAIIGVMIASAVLVLSFIASDTARIVADVWAGASSVTGLMPYTLSSIPVLMSLAVSVLILHKPLLGEAEDPELELPEPEAGEKAVRKRINWCLFGVWLVCTATYFGAWSIPRRLPVHALVQFGAFTLMVASRSIVEWLFRKQLAPFERKDRDGRLTGRATSIAPEGRRVKEVRVDDSREGRARASALAQIDGRILVSRALVDDFTAEEFDFAVAQAAAQGPWQVLRIALLTIPFAILGTAWPAFWMLGPLRHSTHLEGQMRMLLMMGPWLGILLAGGFLFVLSVKRRFARADRAALAITRDLPAAERAIQKLYTTGGRPYTEAKADPKLAWRLTALRCSARELGLTS